MKRPLSWLVALLFSGTALAQTAPTVKSLGALPPTHVLYVGHSFFYFNNGLPDFVAELLDADDPKNDFHSRMVTIGGAPLAWHDVGAYLRPGAMQGFRIEADGTLVFEKHRSRTFDAVIMMDCSQCPIHPQLKAGFHEAARKDSKLVTEHGAKPVLFMTWAYKNKPDMTARLAEEYTRAGNESGALVIPAGLAFAAAVAKSPGLELYDLDKRHPSVAGSYLAACTVIATVYGKNPIGNSYRGGLEPKIAAFLQQVAADTVQQYFGR
jgi:hypothetical protein